MARPTATYGIVIVVLMVKLSAAEKGALQQI
jgi:hypothetical protein